METINTVPVWVRASGQFYHILVSRIVTLPRNDPGAKLARRLIVHATYRSSPGPSVLIPRRPVVIPRPSVVIPTLSRHPGPSVVIPRRPVVIPRPDRGTCRGTVPRGWSERPSDQVGGEP
jgi:hypothetical protein